MSGASSAPIHTHPIHIYQNYFTSVLGSPKTLAALLLVFVLLAWGSLYQGHNWGDDFAAYLLQAQSLLDRSVDDFLAANRFTILESDRTIGPIAYPWGTPLLLAPILWLSGLDFFALKSLNILAYLGFLTVLWFGLRRSLGSTWGAVFVALFACNPALIQSMNQILSDIPFLFFAMLAVMLIRRAALNRNGILPGHPKVDTLLAGLAAVLPWSIRATGLLFLPYLVYCQAVGNYRNRPVEPGGRSRWKAFLPATRQQLFEQLLPYLSMIAAIAAWQLIFPTEGYGERSSTFFDLGSIAGNIKYYFFLPWEILQPIPYNRLAFGLCAGLTAAGVWSRLKDDHDLLVYLLLMLAPYLPYRFQQGLRFIFPILPILLYFLIHGFLWVSRGSNQRWPAAYRRVTGAGLLLLLGYFIVTAGNAALQNLSQGRPAPVGPQTIEAQNVMKYIRKHTPADRIIIFTNPRALRLFTGRWSAAISDPARLQVGDYLLSPNYKTDPMVTNNPGDLILVYKNDRYRLYQIIH
ncbi:MAG: hypothetical protein ACKOC5_03455 [Chloroflexota bacterium]